MTDARALVLDALFHEVAGHRVLAGAYLRVEPGRVVGLLGLNGSGKSTLLKIAAGQIRPASGLVIVDGERLHRPALRRRYAHAAYLPQDPLLPGGVRIGAAIRSFPPAARALLGDPLLRGRLGGRVGELSSGEQRYLEFRLMLALGRAYTLLDEPFTGVEPRLIERMVAGLRHAAARGQAFVVADHYYRYVLAAADTLCVVRHRQCYPLDPDADARRGLEAYGYLPPTHEPTP